MQKRLVAAAVLAIGGTLASCGSSRAPQSRARLVSTRTDLIGGARALGDLGDYKLENDKVRVVIQAPGFSRGFGVYGGSLIDADLRRPNEQGTSGQASGYDNFGELFPAFFVQAVAVSNVRIVRDGSDGGPASIEAYGEAGDFLELAAVLNRAVTGSNADFQSAGSAAKIRYSTTYELAPGASWVSIRFRVENISNDTLKFPSDDASSLLGLLNLPLEDFTVPVGDIALFGSTCEVFIPGYGFDQRFALQAAYAKNTPFPAFPGFVGEFIASRSDHVSYGLIAAPSENNYALHKRQFYEDAVTPVTDSSILFAFTASSFVGMYYVNAPAELPPHQWFDTTKYFLIGSGDVGSIVDEVYQIRGTPVGRLGGQVFDKTRGSVAKGARVLVYQHLPTGERRIFSQYDVREDGQFGGTLEPGEYSLRVAGGPRPKSELIDFRITAGQTTPVRLESELPGRVVVRILSEDGVPLPAKASVIGTFGPEYSGQMPKDFLFDLQIGEDYRASDMIIDNPDDPSTRRYIETIGYTSDGTAVLQVRPGAYEVVSSRGPEYNTKSSPIQVASGETVTLSHSLRRVVSTPGWIAGDTHIHTVNSIDADQDLDTRVRAVAGEGLEWAVATDHNYVTDYGPYIARNDLNRWLFSMVGIEMTTLESGHFNGYPLEYQTGPITHGSLEWAHKTPTFLFENMRNMGAIGHDNTIIQVNHPRDSVMGYFTQYARDTFTFEEVPPTAFGRFTSPTGPAFRDAQGNSTFSPDFEAIELGNWKIFYELHHYRVPEQLPDGPIPADIPPTGTIVVDSKGQAAFPGIIDDWFNTLNLGQRYIGMGTSDSHRPAEEPGYFRTMVYVGDDDPQLMTHDKIVSALRTRRVLVTNGPMMDFYVNDPVAGAMGQTIQATGSDTVQLTWTLTSAPWISVSRINVYRNGTIASVIEIDPDRDLSTSPAGDTLALPLAANSVGAPIDSWFVLEAIGYRSMFPVVRPLELPPLLISDAVSSLAGPLGLSSSPFGALQPLKVFPTTAFAITNPIWVKLGSGEWQPPGIVPFDVLNKPENYSRLQEGIRVVSTIKQLPMKQPRKVGRWPGALFDPRASNPYDVRKTISRFGHDGGHK